MKALYWIIASLITLSGFGTMAAGMVKMKSEKPNYVSSKENYENIRNLDIDLGSEELTVVSSADARVCTVEFCDVSENVIVKQDGDTLRINIKPNTGLSFFDFNTPDSKVIITLPEEQMKNVLIDNGSGSVSVEHVQADTMKVDNGSGGIGVSDTKSRIGDLHTGSGGIVIADVSFLEDARLHSGSGSISGQNFAAPGGFTMDAGSGSIRLDGVTAGKTNATVGSGDLNLSGLSLTDTAAFKAGSGDIALTFNGDPADYIISADSGSGETQVEGFGKEKHANAVTVKANSGSGDVIVQFAAPQEAVSEAE